MDKNLDFKGIYMCANIIVTSHSSAEVDDVHTHNSCMGPH